MKDAIQKNKDSYFKNQFYILNWEKENWKYKMKDKFEDKKTSEKAMVKYDSMWTICSYENFKNKIVHL